MPPMQGPFRFVRAATVVLGLFTASTASAWTPATSHDLAFEAARLAPPDLYRQLVRNRESFALGIRQPYTEPSFDDQRADQRIVTLIANAVTAIEAHRPFNEIAYRLGLVAHHMAAANNPLTTLDHDQDEARYAQDFTRYLDSTQPRIRRVFYGFEQRVPDPAVLVQRTLERSRGWYPLVGREYRRIAFGSGVRSFDDRSTAYAVAALATNHTVSDIAEALRLIWLRAGGTDTRKRLPIRGQQILHLAPSQGVR